MREQGTVQFYNEERGFGFVRRTGAPNVFFHIKNFTEQPAAIERGTQLSFVVTTNPRDGRIMADEIEIRQQ